MDSIRENIENRLKELRDSSLKASQSQTTIKNKIRKLLEYDLEDKDKNFVKIYFNTIEQKMFTSLVNTEDYHMDIKDFLIGQVKRILEYHRDYLESYWVSKELTNDLTCIIAYANVSNILYNEYVELKSELKKIGII